MGIFDKINESIDKLTGGKPAPPDHSNYVFETFYVTGFNYYERYLSKLDPNVNYTAKVMRYPTNDGTDKPLTVFLGKQRVGYILDNDIERVECLLKYAQVMYLNIGTHLLSIGMKPKNKT